MPIKNYTTKVAANRSIEEIQTALIKHGASAMMFAYEQRTGRIEALHFQLKVNDKPVAFSLPVNWRRFQAVLKKQNIYRHKDEEYVYRVSWRCLRDWVLAQLALYETEMVELPQVFLPFATTKTGQTFYEIAKGSDNLLGSGE